MTIPQHQTPRVGKVLRRAVDRYRDTKGRADMGSKLRVHRTITDNLTSNLRGEVGEIITTWTLWRSLRSQERSLQTEDVAKDMQNKQLTRLTILTSKLRDELVARLWELSDRKIGRLNFHFAAVKLSSFEKEARAYAKFIASHPFRKKRNHDIRHKELPERWEDHRHIHVPYCAILRALAMALRVIKAIDRSTLGPSAPYLWREVRKKRYTPMAPPKITYMILPHYRLSDAERVEVFKLELAAGLDSWSAMPTRVDDRAAVVMASKKWGLVALGSGVLVLPQYPLQKIEHIKTREAANTSGSQS